MKWPAVLTTAIAVVVGAMYDDVLGLKAWPFPVRLVLAAILGALVHVVITNLRKAWGR